MAKKGGYKPKRSKYGRERFSYNAVSSSSFMESMRTGRFGGKKISRRGSSIKENAFGPGTMTVYSIATRRKY